MYVADDDIAAVGRSFFFSCSGNDLLYCKPTTTCRCSITLLSDMPHLSSESSWAQAEHNVMRPLNPYQTVLDVEPLNSVPYTGPPLTSNDPSPSEVDPPYTGPPFTSNIDLEPSEVDSILQIKNQPAMVFLPSHATKEEWKNVSAATRNGIVVTGSAALGNVGRPLGLIDIGESEDSYLFRVLLPGVPRDGRFRCDVEPNGKILITGASSTGQRRVCKNNMVFEMQSQNLSPSGEFSVSFRLAGPIDEQQIITSFGNDGIFEGVVKKRR